MMMDLMIMTLWSVKLFVDAEISKLPKPATDVLKLDGSRGMTGDLNMNNNLITNCGRLTMVADGNSPINRSTQRSRSSKYPLFGVKFSWLGT